MTSSNEATWLTQEAHDRLRDELIYLLETARKDIARKIQEAREEGDLKENGGYHAAKEEQGKIDARQPTGFSNLGHQGWRQDHILCTEWTRNGSRDSQRSSLRRLI